MPQRLPLPEQVKPNTPLRLSVVAALAFPDGSMTASGLRREGARGRLVIERVAGKDYTTLANIERMRELCRVEAREPGSSSAKSAETQSETSHTVPPGSSATESATLSQDALQRKLQRLRE